MSTATTSYTIHTHVQPVTDHPPSVENQIACIFTSYILTCWRLCLDACCVVALTESASLRVDSSKRLATYLSADSRTSVPVTAKSYSSRSANPVPPLSSQHFACLQEKRRENMLRCKNVVQDIDEGQTRNRRDRRYDIRKTPVLINVFYKPIVYHSLMDFLTYHSSRRTVTACERFSCNIQAATNSSKFHRSKL